MKLNLSADEVLTTTRSVRKRLDFDRPLERSLVEECLNIALQAPTGGNSQGWHFIVVEDPATRLALADIYRANWAIYSKMPAGRSTGDIRDGQLSRVRDSASFLADNFERAPMMMIPCIQGRLENLDVATGAGAWGSLLPAVWSFMLALRNRGIGSAWTTIHLIGDGEKKAAELLGIPFDKITQGGLFPIAYTKGTDFQPAKRLPLEKVLHWNKW
jgi:nitroreductase